MTSIKRKISIIFDVSCSIYNQLFYQRKLFRYEKTEWNPDSKINFVSEKSLRCQGGEISTENSKCSFFLRKNFSLPPWQLGPFRWRWRCRMAEKVQGVFVYGLFLFCPPLLPAVSLKAPFSSRITPSFLPLSLLAFPGKRPKQKHPSAISL